MPELIRMKALRSWRNDDFEGAVSFGREFMATEMRARDLERMDPPLATRVPANSGTTVKVAADQPQESPTQFAVQPRPLADQPGQARKFNR